MTELEFTVPGSPVDVAQMNACSEAFSACRANRIARNAVTSTGIVNAARDQRAARSYRETFGVKLPCAKSITHQDKSGRCWMFSTLNVLRVKTMRVLDVDDFEFSQAYLTFYEKLEKSNAFLDRIIQTADRPANDRVVNHITLNNASDGGQFMFCASLVEKWGLVPKGVMPETACTIDTKYLTEALGELLIADAAKLRAAYAQGASADELVAQKNQMLEAVHRLLCCCIGEPPTTFDFAAVVGENAQVDAALVDGPNAQGERILRDRGITPQQFVKRYVGFDANDYIELTSIPGKTRPFGHLYGIDWFDIVVGGRPLRLLNMEMSVLERAIIASLKAGEPVYMMCDVGKRALRYAQDFKGLMADDAVNLEDLFDVDLSIDRGDAFDLNATGMSHCMVFQGVELDGDGEPVMWRVENSHGADEDYAGFLHITRDWWRVFGGDVVVERRFVDDDVLELRDTLPVEHRDPWDGFINYRPW